VIENLVDAREHGAEPFNYVEVNGALRDGNVVCGVRVRDAIEETEAYVKGRLVVNAGGPWFDHISGRMGACRKPRVRMTKGIHIVCPPLSRQALVFFSRFDNRLFFVVPWFGHSLVGTTDTDYFEDPGDVRAQPEDVDYLLKSIQNFIPSIKRQRPFYSYAGVRALVPEDGSPSSISRMHRIIDEAHNGSPGLISIIGGKITGYRAIAEEAVNMVCLKLGSRHDCRTATTPLPGCRDNGAFEAGFLEEATFRHLTAVYGSRAIEVVDLARSDIRLRARLAPDHPDIAAQIVHSIRSEQCVRATDFLLRRSLIGFSPDQGRSALPAVVACMAEELNWSDARMNEEYEAHMRWIEQTRIDDLRLTIDD
jgi:glycerol-3-phosphate dehydrogenase